MSYNIRRARISDINAVLAIEQASFADPWSVSMITDDILDTELGIRTYVLTVDGNTAGYYFYYPLSCDLANLAVSPLYRGKGYGRILVDHCIAEARKDGSRELFLEVRESNTAARRLYRSFGFEIIGKRKDYYDHPSEDGLVMLLRIDNGTANEDFSHRNKL
ncbi:MAG: ribosomal protein S18-alanine N-acetyltransferase [Abditibacteriota bacterium]|nr:ribosomal protein S18-alanine N-acetyltransferase [Abditibacteriota bacterium]